MSSSHLTFNHICILCKLFYTWFYNMLLVCFKQSFIKANNNFSFFPNLTLQWPYMHFYSVIEDESSVIDLSSQLETDSVFSQMQGDLDQQRLLGERPIPSVDPFLVREIHNKERYCMYFCLILLYVSFSFHRHLEKCIL